MHRKHPAKGRTTWTSLPTDVSRLGISSRRPPGVKALSAACAIFPSPVSPRLARPAVLVKSAYLPAALPVSCKSKSKCILRRATASPGANPTCVYPHRRHTQHRNHVATLLCSVRHEAPLDHALGPAAQQVVPQQRRIQAARSEVRNIGMPGERPLGRGDIVNMEERADTADRADDLIPEESELVQRALKRLSPKESYDRVFRMRRAFQVHHRNGESAKYPGLV